jgi:hypothetical protein
MKKIIIYFLLCILIINCVNPRNIGNNRDINREILGRLYIERNAGFSMNIPRGWRIRNEGLKYNVIIGPTENNFRLNINFRDVQYSVPVSEYIDFGINIISQLYSEYEFIQTGYITTYTGLQGVFITINGIINEIKVRQKIYYIQNKEETETMIITTTVPSVIGDKYDMIFDECIKTFNWIE